MLPAKETPEVSPCKVRPAKFCKICNSKNSFPEFRMSNVKRAERSSSFVHLL